LDLVTGAAVVDPILDVAGQATWTRADRNLCVVELPAHELRDGS
jgi:hypothetical protein